MNKSKILWFANDTLTEGYVYFLVFIFYFLFFYDCFL